MAQNSSMLLKLILAGVVLTLIVALANYLNISKSATDFADSGATAELIGNIADGKVFAATFVAMPKFCNTPVVPGTSMSQNDKLSYYANQMTAWIGIPESGSSPYGTLRYGAASRRMACMIMKFAITMQIRKEPGFLNRLVEVQETANYSPSTTDGCDVPDRLTDPLVWTDYSFKLVC